MEVDPSTLLALGYAVLYKQRAHSNYFFFLSPKFSLNQYSYKTSMNSFFIEVLISYFQSAIPPFIFLSIMPAEMKIVRSRGFSLR